MSTLVLSESHPSQYSSVILNQFLFYKYTMNVFMLIYMYINNISHQSMCGITENMDDSSSLSTEWQQGWTILNILFMAIRMVYGCGFLFVLGSLFALDGGGASAHSGYPLGLRALWMCASSDFLSSAVVTYCCAYNRTLLSHLNQSQHTWYQYVNKACSWWVETLYFLCSKVKSYNKTELLVITTSSSASLLSPTPQVHRIRSIRDCPTKHATELLVHSLIILWLVYI